MTLLRDISVTSFCLASSAYLYLLHHRRTTPPLRSSLAEGYILTNQVTHARLLPVTSKHAFSYHTLSLLLSLSALENGSLNIGWGGIVFGYPGIWGRVCGLRPGTYVRDYGNRRTAIRSKLADLLKPSGMKLGEVWMMTMPSFLGFEGINPLTVYFCYDEGKADVWGLVLEVHNTFGERHAYVLQVGKGEDGADKRSQEYDHQWTFPRQFHVSPFNDRSGHYVCSVIMPSHPPHSSTTSEAPSKPPRPVIRLHLLTAPPTPQLKLVALLRPILAEPLTARTLLGALVLPPFGSSSRSFPQAYLDSGVPKPSSASWSSLPLGAALLLTSLRIIYQAAHLHYHRGLAVFARPEPIAGLGREWVEKALGGVWNDVQPNQSEDTIIGGSIGWQSESPTERWARERFKKCMEKLGVAVRVASTDPLVPITLLGAGNRQLTLCYRTPRTWTSILLAPTAEYALEIGSRAERWFSVSDEALFCELWNKSAGSEVESSWVGNTAASIRARLAYTTIASPERPPPHPLDNPASPSLLLHLCLLYIAFHAERLVFLASKARFVKGDTPWRVWDRIGRGPKAWKTPQIENPTYTYQCEIIELRWRDGTSPFSVWFNTGGPGRGSSAPLPGLGAWHNITEHNFLVPCAAPAGSRITLMLKDSTGWISSAPGSFLVLPSTDSSCLNNFSSNAADLSESQSIFTSIMDAFQQSIISDILASTTASTTATYTTPTMSLSETSTATSIPNPETSSSNPINLGRILGPVLASLFVVLLCIAGGICFLRRRRRKPDRHIPLNSASAFDLLDEESVHRVVHSPLVETRGEAGAGGQAGQAPAVEMTAIGAGVAAPRSRLRLHEAWPSAVKDRLSEVPPIPQNENAPEQPREETRTRADTQVQDPSLEQRAEQLSGPELERLAALVARRLERVRGAPPQYQATEGVGV